MRFKNILSTKTNKNKELNLAGMMHLACVLRIS